MITVAGDPHTIYAVNLRIHESAPIVSTTARTFAKICHLMDGLLTSRKPLIGILADMRVTIEPHNPEWPLKFSEIHDQLRDILKDVNIISIEHVGSTSIPSLMAKPVLDIDIIIQTSSLEAARNALKIAEYTDCGEMNVPGRFAFRQPGYGRFDAAHGKGKDGELRYNTYLMIEGCAALRNHLDTKRVLMGDQELREEYARVKSKLTEIEFENIGQYAFGKTEILCKILRTAGWSEKDLEPVIRANS